MPVLFSDPFDTLQRFQQAIDAFRTSSWLGTGPSAAGTYPPLNVFRKGEDVVVITEVPGMRKSDIQVQVKGNTIRISGSKSIDYGQTAGLHRRERRAGRFDRAITVPVEIDPDGVRAEYREGILALYLPQAERDKLKAITIS